MNHVQQNCTQWVHTWIAMPAKTQTPILEPAGKQIPVENVGHFPVPKYTLLDNGKLTYFAKDALNDIILTL